MVVVRRCCWPVALVGLIWSVAAVAQGAAEAPILTFDQYHPLLSNQTGEPLVQVYASGRVDIVRPAGYRNPGRFSSVLSPVELQGFLRQMRDAQRLSPREARIAVDEANANTGEAGEELVISSDPTISRVRFAPAIMDDGAPGAAGGAPAEMQSMSVQNLSAVAEKSTSPGIQSLREIEKSMLALLSRVGGQNDE